MVTWRAVAATRSSGRSERRTIQTTAKPPAISATPVTISRIMASWNNEPCTWAVDSPLTTVTPLRVEASTR